MVPKTATKTPGIMKIGVNIITEKNLASMVNVNSPKQNSPTEIGPSTRVCVSGKTQFPTIGTERKVAYRIAVPSIDRIKSLCTVRDARIAPRMYMMYTKI